MNDYELKKVKDFYKSGIVGYKEVGKGRLRRVVVYSNGKVNEQGKTICSKTSWGYPDRTEWRDIFMALGGTVGELPEDIIKC